MVAASLPLTLTAVSIRRGGKVLLGPIDASLKGHGITVLMGPNGAGKTTLLRLMHGLERPRSGSVHWALAPEEARKRQAFVFQHPTILRRSVLDNIAFPLRLHGLPKAIARARATEMAERVGIGALIHQPGAVLSGGEKQKLAVARALITQPEVLFLDEPCANLDGHSTRDIEAILTAARDLGTRIVMSTHDLGQARRLAEEVWFLNHGQIVERSDKTTFFAAPSSAEAQAFIRGDLIP